MGTCSLLWVMGGRWLGAKETESQPKKLDCRVSLLVRNAKVNVVVLASCVLLPRLSSLAYIFITLKYKPLSNSPTVLGACEYDWDFFLRIIIEFDKMA